MVIVVSLLSKRPRVYMTSICFLRQQIVEFPALARWRVAWISNSCVSPHIDNKNKPMSAREFLQLYRKWRNRTSTRCYGRCWHNRGASSGASKENLHFDKCSHSISRSPKLPLVFLLLGRNTVHVFYFLNAYMSQLRSASIRIISVKTEDQNWTGKPYIRRMTGKDMQQNLSDLFRFV